MAFLLTSGESSKEKNMMVPHPVIACCPTVLHNIVNRLTQLTCGSFYPPPQLRSVCQSKTLLLLQYNNIRNLHDKFILLNSGLYTGLVS